LSPLKTALLVASLPLALAILPASAAPLMPTQSSKATLPIEQVQYRGGHGHGGFRGGHGHGGGIAGAVIGGLAVGALIAGAAAANQEAQDHHAYCAQRYRSYDPASGTFLARDGMRYPCQ